MHTYDIQKLHIDERTEYRLRRQVPWLFRKNTAFDKNTPQNGDLVAIYGRRNQCIKLGLYDAYGDIAVHILGDPGYRFDEAYIAQRVADALERRANMHIADDSTNGLRLISGESEGLPGIVLDAYHTTWVLKIYAACWMPYLDTLIEALGRYQNSEMPNAAILQPHRMILRFGRNCLRYYEAAGYREGSLAFGSDTTPYAEFLECGARFRAQVFKGQKTGFFLDQRNNRQLIRQLAAGRKVLDICCYSGGFSINAAMGGASQVWSLDGDRNALDLVQKHYEINADNPKLASAEHILEKCDMFEWLDQPKRHRAFDLVIADPPSFASSQAQMPSAEKAYMRLFAMAADCLRPGGQILCCSCSSHIGAEKFEQIVDRTLRHRTRTATDYTGLPPDHIAAFAEARYLKAWLITVK